MLSGHQRTDPVPGRPRQNGEEETGGDGEGDAHQSG